MMQAVLDVRCPICHSLVHAEAKECEGCHARRSQRKGMTPRAFTAYALLWLALTAVIAALALRIALAPWIPGGTAPEYALAVLGAREAAEPPGCRVTVRDLDGHQIQTIVAGSCDAAEAAAGRAPAPKPSALELATVSQRRIASAMHSALALGLGIAVAMLLRTGLRRAFSRRVPSVAWVLRPRA